MAENIDFWFSIGSTYTYLTVMRIETVAQRSGVNFRWRPFDVRAVMAAMDNIPFSTKPIKARYMWRDVERRALMYGVPWSGVPPYPLKHLTFVNRIALIGSKEGWCSDYARAAYRRWFGEKCDVSVEPDLSKCLRDIGQDPNRVLTLAASDEWKTALQVETNAASALGIFGAPTFAIGEEIFWGDDRLDDAIVWRDRSA
jgi:2-hydroxychromene-2-carboxylate isomerase